MDSSPIIYRQHSRSRLYSFLKEECNFWRCILDQNDSPEADFFLFKRGRLFYLLYDLFTRAEEKIEFEMPIKLMGIDRLRISNAFSTQTNKKCTIYCNNAKSTCFFIDVFLRPEHPTIFLNSSCPFRHLEDNSRYSDLDTMLTS